MNLPLIWSPEAREEYAEILQFLDAEYGTNSALKMLDKVEAVVERIQMYPRAFPSSTLRSDIRKAVVTPQTSVPYRITDTQIQLLHFWDNRQNPQRMEFLP